MIKYCWRHIFKVSVLQNNCYSNEIGTKIKINKKYIEQQLYNIKERSIKMESLRWYLKKINFGEENFREIKTLFVWLSCNKISSTKISLAKISSAKISLAKIFLTKISRKFLLKLFSLDSHLRKFLPRKLNSRKFILRKFLLFKYTENKKKPRDFKSKTKIIIASQFDFLQLNFNVTWTSNLPVAFSSTAHLTDDVIN